MKEVKIQMTRNFKKYNSLNKYTKNMLQKHPNRDVEVRYNKKTKTYHTKLTIKPKRRIKNQVISKPYKR